MESETIERSARSVFIGNISYDVTQEELVKTFTSVGPIVSFKLVTDKDTGKSKGFGFCEYRDISTALSAMRNLNGTDFFGRTLRVDSACNEKGRSEIQGLLNASEARKPCSAEDAPQIISETVASMDPMRLQRIMYETQQCIKNDPQQAFAMFESNPQMAYAIVQILVISRVLKPEQALKMLFAPNQLPPDWTQLQANPQAQKQLMQKFQEQFVNSASGSGSTTGITLDLPSFIARAGRSTAPTAVMPSAAYVPSERGNCYNNLWQNVANYTSRYNEEHIHGSPMMNIMSKVHRPGDHSCRLFPMDGAAGCYMTDRLVGNIGPRCAVPFGMPRNPFVMCPLPQLPLRYPIMPPLRFSGLPLRLPYNVRPQRFWRNPPLDGNRFGPHFSRADNRDRKFADYLQRTNRLAAVHHRVEDMRNDEKISLIRQVFQFTDDQIRDMSNEQREVVEKIKMEVLKK